MAGLCDDSYSATGRVAAAVGVPGAMWVGDRRTERRQRRVNRFRKIAIDILTEISSSNLVLVHVQTFS